MQNTSWRSLAFNRQRNEMFRLQFGVQTNAIRFILCNRLVVDSTAALQGIKLKIYDQKFLIYIHSSRWTWRLLCFYSRKSSAGRGFLNPVAYVVLLSISLISSLCFQYQSRTLFDQFCKDGFVTLDYCACYSIFPRFRPRSTVSPGCSEALLSNLTLARLEQTPICFRLVRNSPNNNVYYAY